MNQHDVGVALVAGELHLADVAGFRRGNRRALRHADVNRRVLKDVAEGGVGVVEVGGDTAAWVNRPGQSGWPKISEPLGFFPALKLSSNLFFQGEDFRVNLLLLKLELVDVVLVLLLDRK